MALGVDDTFLAPVDAFLPSSTINTLTALPKEVLDSVMAYAVAHLSHSEQQCLDEMKQRMENSAIDAGISNKDILRQAVAAMSCILVHCARENVTGELAQRQVLAEVGSFSDETTISSILRGLDMHLPRIQSVLRYSSFDFAHVVDISWRLDYVLRSSTSGNIHQPLYIVDLTVQPPATASTLQHVQFTCTVVEMRELVYRLQDASNTIEKLMNNNM